MTREKAVQSCNAIAGFGKNFFPILFNAYGQTSLKDTQLVCVVASMRPCADAGPMAMRFGRNLGDLCFCCGFLSFCVRFCTLGGTRSRKKVHSPSVRASVALRKFENVRAPV